MKKLVEKWYLAAAAGFVLFAALVFFICGEGSIIAVHDNLDLFVAQFQMLKNTASFFKHDVSVPFLGGITRDCLPSEFSLYSMLYMVLPSYYAYVTGYLLKIVIAVLSCMLLGSECYGEDYGRYRPLVVIVGLAYGVLNVFPAFGIPFASIPLLLYLLLRLCRTPKWREGGKYRLMGLYAGLFLYPMLSYFSYFGLFILAYLLLALLWCWIKERKFPIRLLFAEIVLSLGYIVWEYRLFYMMLFGEAETIRSTMDAGSYTLLQAVQTMGEGFLKGMFHAESVHTCFVLPVCLIYFILLNVSYCRSGNRKGIFSDVYNLLMLALVFNSVIYGLYYLEPVRNVIEMLVPPLTGWQFNRTIFFNPFIWYAAFFLVLKRLYDTKKRAVGYLANGMAIAAVLIIVLSGTRYNDLYHTGVAKVYEILKGKPSNDLSYEEFYSVQLFEKAKKDLNYCGQWSVAYGFHPAILEYNDIATLDGYLGFYEQLYKEEFRKIIAPALDRVPESAEYFDGWGARAYLYSGTETSIVAAVRDYRVESQELYMDTDAFKKLGGRYLFARMPLTNAEEAGFTLAGTYTDETSPYCLYVYKTTSRYREKDHASLSFREMKDIDYDRELVEEAAAELEDLAESAFASEKAENPGRVLELYREIEEELTRVLTCSSIREILYNKDVSNEEMARLQQQALEDCIDMKNCSYVALAKICSSPYRETMLEIMSGNQVEEMAQYEELSEESKKDYLKENSLSQEYLTAYGEDYFFTYNGEVWNMDRLNEESDRLSREDWAEIYNGIYRERNKVLGEIFLEMVQLRDKIAKDEDYDNYAEYAYDSLYLRDYTLEDVRKLFAMVKKEISPRLYHLESKTDEEALMDLPYTTARERLLGVRDYLDEIDPELQEALDYLLEYELYDMDEEPAKSQTGFTIKLPYYGAAFIFDSPYGNYRDWGTAIHEFGHYNYMLHNLDDVIWDISNIDLMEIHSQGLEMLFCEDGRLLGDLSDEYAIVAIYCMAEAIVESCLSSEFEIRVYENPGMSLEDMNKLYCNLARQYGINVDASVTELTYWIDISHFYTQPCYVIGYATSAFTSLDLLALSQKNREEAVEKYMQFTTLPLYAPYCSAVEYTGLRNIFSGNNGKDIFDETLKVVQRLKE